MKGHNSRRNRSVLVMMPGYLILLRWVLLSLLCGLYLPFTLLAQPTETILPSDPTLYEAQVPVSSQNQTDRVAGMKQALRVVLSKLSGQPDLLTRPDIESALRIAPDLAETHRYQQQQTTSASGAPGFRTLLVVRFRKLDVDDLVTALGLPQWPQPRPQPVLWLVIDDGSGPRLVSVRQANAVQSILEQATQRGYSLGLPQGTASESALAAALWRQEIAALSQASVAYQSPQQLLGRLYRRADGWAADWIMLDNGTELARWNTQDADARQAMAAGADGAANALIARQAGELPSSSIGQAGLFRVRVSGIASTSDYLRLSSSLQTLSVVQSMVPIRAADDWLELDLQLLTGLGGFNRLLGPDSTLQPLSMGMDIVNTGTAEYLLRPAPR